MLTSITHHFIASTSFQPLIGAEIEFYLPRILSVSEITAVTQALLQQNIPVLALEKETGKTQYELILEPADPVSQAHHIQAAKKVLAQYQADFSALPCPGQPGSGLHIHLSLYDATGHNVFRKTGEEESDALLYAIGGLLECLPASVRWLAPKAEDYARFRDIHHTPSTVSWGGNNRTVALRLPAVTQDPESRRIEHRVAAADADPGTVIACILLGTAYGLTHHIKPASPKIFGNAWMPEYHLASLPESLQEAKTLTHPAFAQIALATNKEFN